MTQLLLFSTLGCHLCEQAETLLRLAASRHKLSWRVVEIADEPELVDRYGIRIPVILDPGANRELGWPFDSDTLDEWLAAAA